MDEYIKLFKHQTCSTSICTIFSWVYQESLEFYNMPYFTTIRSQ